MNERANKIVHITWEEAHRAEAERNEARRTPCSSLPPSRYFKSGPTKAAIVVFAAIILLACVGTVSYLEQGNNYLFRPSVKRGLIAQDGLRTTSNPEVTAEASKTHYVAPQLSSRNYETAQSDDRESIAKRSRGELANFEVVDDSFVRDRPEANATIIATLRPARKSA